MVYGVVIVDDGFMLFICVILGLTRDVPFWHCAET